ncbi:Stk1 family PASTA domain-containing Ser/Thr kinase [Arthrobacter bussei]|uniref:non-specific serine/threonine protein kinase n=1 Tax=Arthrobacter bussei TaxID=2594179 RepID=A0A7X1NQH1_9MICC|nr:serine/threonine protein kinase [Arthrobacter bussei]
MHQQRRDPLEGATVDGRYVVESRLARGGMSTVYLATDRRLDRRVALKVLYPHLADEPGFIDRFEQEAKSAARLSHPHVVGVLDQGVDEVKGQAIAYLVMEFVQGRTLREVLREHGRLTPRHALVLLDSVVEGLAAAHDAGLIHRDVKPENVLLSDSGQVKIADFGLARAVSATTGTATLVGTVAYLSPELVLGRPAEAQSDIYSTGVMLYELLTGRQPFTGETPIQVAIQHAQSDVPAPSVLLPGLPQDIDELVQWCTSRDPEDRPVDGAALLGELRHIRTVLTDEELDFVPVGTAGAAAVQESLTAAVVPRLPDARRDDGTAAWPSSDAATGTEILQDGLTGPWHGERRDGIGTEPAGGREDHTEALARPSTGAQHPFPAPAGATEVFRTLDEAHRTSVIGTDRNATRVIGAMPAAAPASSRQEPAPSAARRTSSDAAPGPTADPVRAGGSAARPLSKRQQSREAQRPQQSLHGTAGRRWVRALVVLLVLLAGLVATAGWFFGAGPAGLVSLPDVSNTPLEEARAALADQGLSAIATEEVFDERVLAGLVVATDPAATSEVRRFERVELMVSKGPELFAVPDLLGRAEVDAAARLGAAGLAVGRLEQEYSETVPAGNVLRQTPGADAERRRHSTVDLVVSRGPAPVAVPDVTGLTAEEASAALEQAGLVPAVAGVEEFSGTVPRGAVVSQSPTGTEVQRGATVTLTLSQGPRLVRVPTVFSLSEDRAVAALEEAGFVVEVDYTFGGSVLGLVAGQSLTGEQPEGTTVRITVT